MSGVGLCSPLCTCIEQGRGIYKADLGGSLLELLAFPGLQQVSKFPRQILAPKYKKTLQDAPILGSHRGVHVGPRIPNPCYSMEIGSYLIASAAWCLVPQGG